VGLSYGLDRVEVTISPEDPVRLLRLDGEEKHAAPWSLLALAPAPGYVGALALKAHSCRLVGWHWLEEEPGEGSSDGPIRAEGGNDGDAAAGAVVDHERFG